MFSLILLAPILLVVLVVSLLVRVLTLPLRLARRARFGGSPFGYGAGRYGLGGYGCRHRHRGGLGGSILTVAALFALDRLFGGRRF